MFFFSGEKPEIHAFCLSFSLQYHRPPLSVTQVFSFFPSFLFCCRVYFSSSVCCSPFHLLLCPPSAFPFLFFSPMFGSPGVCGLFVLVFEDRWERRGEEGSMPIAVGRAGCVRLCWLSLILETSIQAPPSGPGDGK
uniref:Uncharacterized protein n=1 Tax=Pipistrellus kuhlii TaxID=59472 RepID=A0A7J7WD71_PIPKU|nr:hypothetical protein mPipKuh1_008057 [Pipistrellus kuhlii]